MLHLVYFNAADPFYFVLLYLQLIFVNTILYRTINRCNRMSRGRLVLKGILGIVIIAISALTTQFSNILDVYGGGGRLFGGTYLSLFYVGMIIAPYLIVRWKKIYLFGTVIGASFLWILWYRFVSKNQFQLDSRFPFGKGINPPGVTLMCYAVIVFIMGICFFLCL